MSNEADESCIVLEPGFKRLRELGGLDDDAAITLASEVVKQAMRDLTGCSHWLRQNPFGKKEKRKAIEGLRKECEWFFRSRWFAMMVDCDAEKLIDSLRKA